MAVTMYPNIEAERARNQLTTQELADKLGVERKSYYNWISKGNIPVTQLIALSKIFNCSVDYLLGLTRNPTRVA